MNPGSGRNSLQLLLSGIIAIVVYGVPVIPQLRADMFIHSHETVTESWLEDHSFFDFRQPLYPFAEAPSVLLPSLLKGIQPVNGIPADGNGLSKRENKPDAKLEKTKPASTRGRVSRGSGERKIGSAGDGDDGGDDKATHNHGKWCPACGRSLCRYAWQQPGIKQSNLNNEEAFHEHWKKFPRYHCKHGCKSKGLCDQFCRQNQASGTALSLIYVVSLESNPLPRFLSLSDGGLLNLWERQQNGFELLQDTYIANWPISEVERAVVTGNQVIVYGDGRAASLSENDDGNWQGFLLTELRTAVGVLPDGRVVTFEQNRQLLEVSSLEQGSLVRQMSGLSTRVDNFHPLSAGAFIVVTQSDGQRLLQRWTEENGLWQSRQLLHIADTREPLYIGGNGDELIVVVAPEEDEPMVWVIDAGAEIDPNQSPGLPLGNLNEHQVIGVSGDGSIISRSRSGDRIQFMARSNGDWIVSGSLIVDTSLFVLSRRAEFGSSIAGIQLRSQQYLPRQNLIVLDDGRIVSTAIRNDESEGEYLLLWTRSDDSTWTYRVLGGIREATRYLVEFQGRLLVCDDMGGIREMLLQERQRRRVEIIFGTMVEKIRHFLHEK